MPEGKTDPTDVSLRHYVETLVTELEKRMDAQFLAAKDAVAAALAAAEKAVAAALVSSDKLTSAAFIAAKEALAEAQTQLAAYKAASNEWRSTLTDLIAKGMLRPEIESLIKALNDKFDGLDKRIAALEGQLQRAGGEADAAESGKIQGRWTVEKILAILALLLALAAFFWKAK